MSDSTLSMHLRLPTSPAASELEEARYRWLVTEGDTGLLLIKSLDDVNAHTQLGPSVTQVTDFGTQGIEVTIHTPYAPALITCFYNDNQLVDRSG